ncbi:hypothetical protein OPQ81_007065 [Rhizoctonia solani]|nr:hypothetical protein OPQ81_007065 [Rhizoctonia solani]
MSNAPSNLGVLSASDTESEIIVSSQSGSASDSDFEVVLVTRATASASISDSDSGSLVFTPSDLSESSDDEHIFVQNITRSTPNTPRPPSLTPSRLNATPRPPAVIPGPIFEDDQGSDISDREDDLSASSFYDSDSDADGSVAARARTRTVTATHDRLEAPIALRSNASLGTVHGNGSTATIRPACPTSAATLRRSAPAGMHTPSITTNTIVGILASAPLSPPTPSDGGEIPYAPFTAAPTAVIVPVSMTPAPATSALKQSPVSLEPPIPNAHTITRKMWSAMNTARMRLGFEPLQHVLREKLNSERKEKGKARASKVVNGNESKAKEIPKAQLAPQPKPKSRKSRARSKAKAKAVANPLVAPRPTVGGSPASSEDEAPRQRASMFSPINDISVRSDSPDEEAYDEAIKQLDEHMTSPPEHPTAAYRFLLNRALLLEFRVCTPETLPSTHGAAIAMVKSNVHINILDYIAKRKEGFSGLRSVMLANAKALRKDVRKRRMSAKKVKSLGLHSLLIHH